MGKGIEFTQAKGNCETYLDEEAGLFYVRVNLNNPELPQSNAGREMMAKGFFSFKAGDKKIHGNLNLNIGVTKSALRDENARLMAQLAEAQAKLAGDD